MHKVILWLLVGLVIIITALQYATPRTLPPIHLGPPQTVHTRNPKVGVHLRLTGSDDEAQIDGQLTAVREMGGHFVVDLFPWAYVQPLGPQQFEWRGADILIAHAHQQGLEIVARLDIVPAWARPPKTSDRYLAPDHYLDFGRYAAAFATRYRKEVRYIQLWNEPNLNLEWGLREPDPAGYARLLQLSTPLIKAANPAAVVIAGSFSPGGSVPGVRLDDLAYLKGMLQAGAPFDLLGIHAYGGRAPAGEEPRPDRVNFRRVEVYRDTLDALAQPHSLIVTEGGWNDHPRWSGAVTPAQRATWTVEAYRLSEQWPDVLAVCLWEWQTPSTHSYQDNWTFVTADGTPKAVYYAVQQYTQSSP